MIDTNLCDSDARTLAQKYDGVLFDLDGVVYRGAHAVTHAPAAINALEIATGFLTNNASRAPEEVAQHLSDLGVPARDAQVATSAQAAAAYAKQTYGVGAKVLKVGGEGLARALAHEGLQVVAHADEEPDVVVQGTSQDITWHDLAEAVYAINAGAHYIATNLDSTMPTERGMALGNGALVAAVSHATGVEPRYAAGKPQAGIFHHAAQQLSITTPLMVGDRLDTDIRGANSAGFDSLVVLTGVAQPAELINAAPADRPSYIARDLRGLHEVHTAPTRVEEAVWSLGGARAWLSQDSVWVSEHGKQYDLTHGDTAAVLSLDGLRAACAAAWSAPRVQSIQARIHIGDTSPVPQ